MVGGLRPEVDAYYEMELTRGGRPPPYAIIQVQHIQERASARALIPACADRCDMLHPLLPAALRQCGGTSHWLSYLFGDRCRFRLDMYFHEPCFSLSLWTSSQLQLCS